MRNILLVAYILCVTYPAQSQLITKDESRKISQLLNNLSATFKPQTYVFRNVTVITMKDSLIFPAHDVLVENGIIKNVGKQLEVEASVSEIDGAGKFLLPGLIDMHAHLFPKHPLVNTWMIEFLLYGVTSIRDMNGVESKDKLLLKERIAKNEIFAPTIYQASQLVDSEKHPYYLRVLTPDDGRKLVRDSKKAGYDFIKIYNGLRADVYHAILEEGAKENIPVVGHVPNSIKLEEAVQAGQNSMEHLMGFFEWDGPVVKHIAPTDYASLVAQSKTWVCATLYNHYLNVSREQCKMVLTDPASQFIPKNTLKIWKNRTEDLSQDVVEIVDKHGEANFNALKNIVLELYHAEAKLVVGTDAGNLPFLIPGYSLLQELMLMNTIGIEKYDVLKMVTSDAATSMGKESELGTIEIGKRADLLLLNKNPLLDLNNLKNRSGVMVRGILLSKEEINRIFAEIKAIFSN